MDRVLEGCHGQVCFATNLKCEIWKKHIRTIYSSSNHVYSHQLTLSKSSKSKKNPWSCGLEIFKMNMASSSCNIGPTPKRGKELLQSGCVAYLWILHTCTYFRILVDCPRRQKALHTCGLPRAQAQGGKIEDSPSLRRQKQASTGKTSGWGKWGRPLITWAAEGDLGEFSFSCPACTVQCVERTPTSDEVSQCNTLFSAECTHHVLNALVLVLLCTLHRSLSCKVWIQGKAIDSDLCPICIGHISPVLANICQMPCIGNVIDGNQNDWNSTIAPRTFCPLNSPD